MIENKRQERKQGLMLQLRKKDRLQYKDKRITGVDRLQKEQQRLKDRLNSKESDRLQQEQGILQQRIG